MIVKHENPPDKQVKDDKTVTFNTDMKDKLAMVEFLEIGLDDAVDGENPCSKGSQKNFGDGVILKPNDEK